MTNVNLYLGIGFLVVMLFGIFYMCGETYGGLVDRVVTGFFNFLLELRQSLPIILVLVSMGAAIYFLGLYGLESAVQHIQETSGTEAK